MNLLKILCLVCIAQWAQAQINTPYYTPTPVLTNTNNPNSIGINAEPYSITILTKVLYNALPDGYHVTYTKSYIGETVASVEQLMNWKMDELVNDAKRLQLTEEDILLDVIALDPIFNLSIRDTIVNQSIGYKITENITFRIKELKKLKRLSKLCLEHDI